MASLFRSSWHNRPAAASHCGCYYLAYDNSPRAVWLPQVSLSTHATIRSTASRTVLTQTFRNTSDQAIKEAVYSFPLYDGVSVVAFSCRVGNRLIKGLVKEKEKARRVYQAALAQGQTAGLLEQLPDASDTFQTKIGNIAAGQDVIVEITYVGELKHDAEVDGIRWNLPTAIASRYGTRAGVTSQNLPLAATTSFSAVVDIMLAENQPVRGVQSPSHPIAVTLGSTSSTQTQDFNPCRASATLSLGSLDPGQDFVLLVLAQGIVSPQALLETHPTIPGSRALMVTLVPKFALKPAKPELVFVIDRSGSMVDNIPTLKSALEVFLKSLPLGVKFNICSFGSSFKFLWPKSKGYDSDTLLEATKYVGNLAADMGGTEMLPPVRATITNRYKDIPLDIMILTDGEIWHQQKLFDHINKARRTAQSPLRVFSLGIGRNVSHSLVEGIARAGDGFSQIVNPGEKLDAKVVRMLKGALAPHVLDYKLEISYGDSDDAESLELTENITSGLQCMVHPSDATPVQEESQTPISLFDPEINLDSEETEVSNTPPDLDGQSRFDHLPRIEQPKYIQAPQAIPSLYPFSRFVSYVLISPTAPQRRPKLIILTGTSPQGPLRLEIPVQVLAEPGEMIHQLAAKKAILELEEGRGWLTDAKDVGGVPIAERYESQFEEMVQREAVRLGVEFQVGGKFCSFVAVESQDTALADRLSAKSPETQKSDISPSQSRPDSMSQQSERDSVPSLGSPSIGTTPSVSSSGYTPYTPGSGTSSQGQDDMMSVTSSTRSTGTFISQASTDAGSLVSASAAPANSFANYDSTTKFKGMSANLVRDRGTAHVNASPRAQKGPNPSSGSTSSLFGQQAASPGLSPQMTGYAQAYIPAQAPPSGPTFGSAGPPAPIFASGTTFGFAKSPAPAVAFGTTSQRLSQDAALFSAPKAKKQAAAQNQAPGANQSVQLPDLARILERGEKLDSLNMDMDASKAMFQHIAKPNLCEDSSEDDAEDSSSDSDGNGQRRGASRFLMETRDSDDSDEDKSSAAPIQTSDTWNTKGAAPVSAGGLFGAAPVKAGGLFGAAPAKAGGLFGAAPARAGGLFGAAPARAGGLFGAAPAQAPLPPPPSNQPVFGSSGVGGALRHRKIQPVSDALVEHSQLADSPDQYEDCLPASDQSSNTSQPRSSSAKPQPPSNPLYALISLQTFDGAWHGTPGLWEILKVPYTRIAKQILGPLLGHQVPPNADPMQSTAQLLRYIATMLVVRFFREKLASEEDTWELVVEKAEEWLNGVDDADIGASKEVAEIKCKEFTWED